MWAFRLEHWLIDSFNSVASSSSSSCYGNAPFRNFDECIGIINMNKLDLSLSQGLSPLCTTWQTFPLPDTLEVLLKMKSHPFYQTPDKTKTCICTKTYWFLWNSSISLKGNALFCAECIWLIYIGLYLLQEHGKFLVSLENSSNFRHKCHIFPNLHPPGCCFNHRQ